MFGKNKAKNAHFELDALSKSYAVIYFTPEGIITDANENFLNCVGYTLDEIKGKHHRIFCDPVYTQSEEYTAFWKKLGEGEIASSQFKRYGKAQQEIWIEATYNPIFDGKGNVTRIVKYASDITDRQEKFADYEGQLDAISKSQAVIQFHMDGTIITANENFLACTGYDLQDIQGQHHQIFCKSEYANSLEYQAFWERLNHGEHFSGEYCRLDKNGNEIWISASYNPIFNTSGKPFKVVKYAIDITEQKKQSTDYEGQLQAIGKSQAVIEFTTDGVITNANTNFLNAVGYHLDEIKGNHHRIFMDSSEANSLEYKAFWESLGKGEFHSGIYKRMTKTGGEIWIQASYNPIFDPSGIPFKVVKYASDVTKTIESLNIAEQATDNLNTVTDAVMQMSSAIGEISKNMNLSKNASSDIIENTGISRTAAEKLSSKMDDMKGIVDLINAIAGHVNLLALNATVEAARAGEAGKGFAVVASEVKNLATETTKATDEIIKRINEISISSEEVITSITNISSTASSVDEYVTSVASAIEEQTSVTREISDGVQQVNDSMQAILKNKQEAS